jgi:phage/plasmid-associated DNA primase
MAYTVFIVDEFISDVLMPCTTKVMPSSELYDLFEKYCAHQGTAEVLSHIAFGKGLAARLWSTKRNGKTFYYCELNPRVLAR